MKRYTWRRDQIFDNLKGCFVMWKTVSGELGIEDDFAEYLMKKIEEDSTTVSKPYKYALAGKGEEK